MRTITKVLNPAERLALETLRLRIEEAHTAYVAAMRAFSPDGVSDYSVAEGCFFRPAEQADG